MACAARILLRLAYKNDSVVYYLQPDALTFELVTRFKDNFLHTLNSNLQLACIDASGRSVTLSSGADLAQACAAALAKSSTNPELAIAIIEPSAPVVPSSMIAPAVPNAVPSAVASSICVVPAPPPDTSAAVARLADMVASLRKTCGDTDVATLAPQVQLALCSFIASPQFHQLFLSLCSPSSLGSNETLAPLAKENEDDPIHERTACNGCGMKPIVGVRYQCAYCPQLNLCAKCEAGDYAHDDTHVFLKLKKPTVFLSVIPTTQHAERTPPQPYKVPARSALHKPAGTAPIVVPTRLPLTLPAALPSAFVLSDVTVPAGTTLPANTAFTKVWRIGNDGQAAWPVDTALQFDMGDELSGVPKAVARIDAADWADVEVEMKTPASPGRYLSYWRLCGEQGTAFGARVCVDIVVVHMDNATQETSAKQLRPSKGDENGSLLQRNDGEDEDEDEDDDEDEDEEEKQTRDGKDSSIEPVAFIRIALPEPRFVYQAPLNQLVAMGFASDERTRELLVHYAGDVERVVEALFKPPEVQV